MGGVSEELLQINFWQMDELIALNPTSVFINVSTEYNQVIAQNIKKTYKDSELQIKTNVHQHTQIFWQEKK